MENSIYLAASKQLVLQTNMDIVANNIANMNTHGYRGQTPMFEEYLETNEKYDDDPISFVRDFGQYQNTAPGPVERTDNDFNIALIGKGYLGVQMPDGRTGYTRNGEFQKTADGTLVTTAGYAVMGQGGPIIIPEDSSELVIDEKGALSNQDGQIGQLMIVEFENEQSLEPDGNNIYTSAEDPAAAQNTFVQQGFLEGSNVQPIIEMNRMIEILREFQSTQKLLENEHDRIRSAIQKLTQA